MITRSEAREGFLARLLVWGVAACAGACFVSSASASYTQFSYTATPGSWVGDGVTSFFASPQNGWTFGMSRSPDNTYISLTTSRINPQSGPNDFHLELKAPAGQTLVPGTYTGATRYPFEAPTDPGIWLSGNGRGDNTNTGYFKILESTPTSLAVDFQQFDESNPNQWVLGEFLYNATVPEPSQGAAVAAFGVIALGICRRRQACSAHR